MCFIKNYFIRETDTVLVVNKKDHKIYYLIVETRLGLKTVLFFKIAKIICINFLIAAPTITILGLDLFLRLRQNALIMGLWFLATIAGKNMAFRSLADPSLDNLVLPLIEDPDCLCEVTPKNQTNIRETYLI